MNRQEDVLSASSVTRIRYEITNDKTNDEGVVSRLPDKNLYALEKSSPRTTPIRTSPSEGLDVSIRDKDAMQNEKGEKIQSQIQNKRQNLTTGERSKVLSTTKELKTRNEDSTIGGRITTTSENEGSPGTERSSQPSSDELGSSYHSSASLSLWSTTSSRVSEEGLVGSCLSQTNDSYKLLTWNQKEHDESFQLGRDEEDNSAQDEDENDVSSKISEVSSCEDACEEPSLVLKHNLDEAKQVIHRKGKAYGKTDSSTQDLPRETLDETSFSEKNDKGLRSVTFDSVTVNYLAVVLGDCPTVRDGPPIARGWELVGDADIYRNIDDYEEKNPVRGMVRIVPAAERYMALEDAGFTHCEMVQCMNEILAYQREIAMERQMKSQQRSKKNWRGGGIQFLQSLLLRPRRKRDPYQQMVGQNCLNLSRMTGQNNSKNHLAGKKANSLGYLRKTSSR